MVQSSVVEFTSEKDKELLRRSKPENFYLL